MPMAIVSAAVTVTDRLRPMPRTEYRRSRPMASQADRKLIASSHRFAGAEATNVPTGARRLEWRFFYRSTSPKRGLRRNRSQERDERVQFRHDRIAYCGAPGLTRPSENHYRAASMTHCDAAVGHSRSAQRTTSKCAIIPEEWCLWMWQ